MALAIHVTTKQKHEAWTAGHCRHCGQTEVIRVERQYRVVWVMFVPLTFRTEKRSFRCDFCERPVDNLTAADEVRTNQWSMAQGPAALARRLGNSQAFDNTSTNSETRLNSLLSSVQEATSLGKINAVPGVIIGIVLGFALGLIVAATCLEIGIDLGAHDRFGVYFGFGLVGGILGAIAGAILYVLMSRGRIATGRIRRAHEKYNLDLRKLEEFAHRHDPRVAQATRTVHDEALLGFQYGASRTPLADSEGAEKF